MIYAIFNDTDELKLWEEFLLRLPPIRGLVWSPAEQGPPPAVSLVTVSAAAYRTHTDAVRSVVSPGGKELVVLASLSDDLSSPALFLQQPVNHLVVCDPRGNGAQWLADRINSLRFGQEWHPAVSLGSEAVLYEIPVRSSDDKEEVIARIQGLVSGSCSAASFLRERAALLVDELLENALYGAPVSTEGDSLFEKGENRYLSSSEDISIRFGFDGRTLALEVSDGWGTLSADKLLHHLAKNSDPASMLDELGGRGLFIVWRLMDAFYISLEPGRRSSLGGHISLGANTEEVFGEKPLFLTARSAQPKIGCECYGK